ncbi:MAG: transketolase C-terminal domain-containing protein [Thermomicrobiales bacterium]
MILRAADDCGCLITVEENAVAGGFGSAVLELLSNEGRQLPVVTLGIPDRIFEQASQKRLRELAGIDDASIVETARRLVEAKRTRRPGFREASAAL